MGQASNILFSRGGHNDDFRPLTYTLGGGGGIGVQGQICDILAPASYESLPAPSGDTDSHTLVTYIWGEALILGRCRAFDLFACVDTHLCFFPPYSAPSYLFLHQLAEGIQTCLLYLSLTPVPVLSLGRVAQQPLNVQLADYW